MVLNDSKDDKSRDRDRTRRNDRPSRFSNISNKDRDRSPLSAGGGDLRRRIIVSNIPFEYRWQDLKDLFRTEVGEVSYVEILNDETGKPRGSAIVEFQSVDMVRKAINKMHRFETKGRKLVIKEAAEENKGRRSHGGSGGVDRSNDSTPILQSQSSKFGNTFGLSPQFLESLGINCPLVNKVFVANLDYKTDEKKLREVFRLAGKVDTVEIAFDKDGKSRGFGTVEFDHPVEAVQAISMLNNQTLFDRRITVRMDRVADRVDGPIRLPEGLKSIGMGLGANGAPLQDVSRNLPNANTNPTPAATINAPAALTAAISALTAQAAQAQQQPAASQTSLGNLGLSLGLGNTGTDLTSTLSNLAAANQNNAYPLHNLGSQSNQSNLQSNILSGMAAYSQNMQSQSATNLSTNMNNPYAGSSQPQDYNSRNNSNNIYNRYSGNEMDYSTSGLQSSAYSNSRSGGSGMTQPAIGNERDTIIIKNLPPTVTWQELRDKFRNIGDVKFAEIKGKDIGLVRFDNAWNAKTAIEMFDRTRLDGRILDVTYF